MRKKLSVLILVIAGLAVVGVIHSASKDKQAKDDQAENRGTFRQRLDRAKARGETKLNSYSVTPIYAYADLDKALATYDLVIAEPIFRKSFQTDDEGYLVTWYKFKLIETLSKAKNPRVFEAETLPEELLPLEKDEILVSKLGGVVEFEGLEIEMKEEGFPEFELSRKYLLFLALDPTTRSGYVDVGPSGVLMVNADSTMESINKERRYFQTQIESRFGRSLSRLKEILN